VIVGVALSPALDVTYVVERLKGIQRPLETVKVAGGKALNAARAAATVGAPRVAGVAVLAGGAGTDVAAHAREAGLELFTVEGQLPTRTCVSIFDRSTRELAEVYEHAVEVTVDEVDRALAAAVSAMAGQGGWYMLSGGLSEEHARRAVRHVKAAGGRIALDTHSTALQAGLEEGPDLVKVNRAEAAELLGRDIGAPAAELASGLYECLAEIADGARAIVTDGAHGAWACDGSQVLHAPPAGSIGDYPVGSGDSFLGGLVTVLDAGGTLSDALALATGAGVANAQTPGAGVLDPAFARGVASRVSVAVHAQASDPH